LEISGDESDCSKEIIIQMFPEKAPKTFQMDCGDGGRMLASKGGPKGGGHKKKGSFAGSSSDGSTLSLIERDNGLITAAIVEVSTGMIYRIFPNRKKETIVTETHSDDMMPMEDDLEEEGATVGRKRRTQKVRGQSQVETAVSPTLLHRTLSERVLGDRVLFDDLGGNIDIMVVWTAKGGMWTVR
jgi:hypothetical protein